MVKLASWRNERGLTVAALAKLIGVSPGAVMKYLSGERPPLRHHALAIAIVTEGKVRAIDLWGEEFAPMLGLSAPDADAPGPAPGAVPDPSEGPAST